ncbi:M1 family metallopeptidase [Planotetraspora sp. GP83]|uniref:M1 family metallopeptidase n=1 Tax=Planotetraspora sp. GP83 TaxID=3156264 RepID=UPI0035128AE8
MSVAHSYFPNRGDDGYRVEHYDLSLDYRIGSNKLTAVARVSAVATRQAESFGLDLGAFRVGKVLVGGAQARHARRGDKLVVTPATALREGEPFVAEVHYAGTPRPISTRWGELGWEELSDGVLVASQPIGAPSWFPCNDRPDDKAAYRISVTTASPYEVVATGALVGKRRAGSATTWMYEQREPMATYLASVQIGRYRQEVVPGPVPQRLAFPWRAAARVRHDFGRQGQMLEAFAKRFGPYPFGGYTVVVAGDELEIPIEAQGMSVFGVNHADGRRGSERLVAHELAHQWFGNSLTIGDWRDIWLHEGFAAYAEWLWSEDSGGDSADEHARRAHRKLAALPQDFSLTDPGLDRLFDDRVYKRGALAVHALRRTLGDAAFHPMLHEWTATHRYGTVSTRQFTSHAERYSARPLETFFWTWLRDPRLPFLP